MIPFGDTAAHIEPSVASKSYYGLLEGVRDEGLV